jgi:protein CpxP
MEQNIAQNSRRRFFRLAGITTAAAGLGTLAFGALAHGRRGGRGPIDPAEMEERIERMLKHVYVEIDATPEQQQKIDPMVKQAAEELRPLRAKVREARREGLRLFSAPGIDRGAIERLRLEQMASADAASKRFAQALADVAEVLTSEQRKTLAARFARRGHGRG